MWASCPGTLRPFNSFLIILNLEKDLSSEQLVTIKLRTKGSRGCINDIRPKRAFLIFLLLFFSLSLLGRVLWLPVGKVIFACNFKLNKIFCDWLSMGAVKTSPSTQQQSDFWRTLLKKMKMEKITSKNTKRALRNIETLTKLQCCSEEATMLLLQDDSASPAHSSYLQYNLKLW